MDETIVSLCFKALSDLSRQKIMRKLYANDSLCVCKLLEILECGQPTLSYHMSVLTKCGLVKGKKEGKWVHYSCNKKLLEDLMIFMTSAEGAQ